MSCKLHIPYLYDPRRDVVQCECGYTVITKQQAALHNRMYLFPRFTRKADAVATPVGWAWLRHRAKWFRGLLQRAVSG